MPSYLLSFILHPFRVPVFMERFWKEQIEEIAEANHKIAVSNPSDQELRTLRRQQRRDILREVRFLLRFFCASCIFDFAFGGGLLTL